jgi:ribosomal-protein-alanine N-acetyltransferase
VRVDLERPPTGPSGRLAIRPMVLADVPIVLRIEALSFTTAWPQNAFLSEINDNRLAHYYVGVRDGQVIAYGGIWVILEDSHITTIAVHPDLRGKRYGEELLQYLIRQACDRDASWMTLEVRESNRAAQSLYRKYGFTIVSTRRGYYSDNNENAYVMWAGNLRGELYRARLAALEKELDAHLASGLR